MRIESKRPEDEGELRLTLEFDAASLRLEQSLIGVVVHLDGCTHAGPPGSPALPARRVHVALPPGTRAAEVTAVAGRATPIGDGPVPVAPVQPPQPGSAEFRDYRRCEAEPRKSWRCGCGPASGTSAETAFPVPPYAKADPELYARAAEEPPARLLGTVPGPTPTASLMLRPVRVLDGGRLELVERLELTLFLEADGRRTDGPPDGIFSRGQAVRDIVLTRTSVLNPADVWDYSIYFPSRLYRTDYLIVTDDHRWDAAAQAPLDRAGDLVATFERLAGWKRQRGMKAAVVTVTDIVGGLWGDFRTGSRDLQETLRNFLKMAYAEWGISWVLIGGDTDIVPVRSAAGHAQGQIGRGKVDPPEPNTSFWAGDHLRMHVVYPGDWWTASADNLLVRVDDGRLIPYDSDGSSSSTSSGWYFTTDDSYAVRTAVPSEFVRVNGPASLVDADMRFFYRWNIVPTDFYYSSLVGTSYGQAGKHDWDLSGNGLYGQWSPGKEFDGIDYRPTVSVGRAPVSRTDDAVTFVEKVIAYESLREPGGRPLDPAWPERAVLLSSNWGASQWIWPTAASPPWPATYHHAAGVGHSLVRLGGTPDWKWSLLCYVNDADVRVLPYRTDAKAAGRGWYFARGADDVEPNILGIPWMGGIIYLPEPTSWIAVFGPAEELSPLNYIFNHTSLDLSLVDQEVLREQLAWETGVARPLRVYEDLTDMTPAQVLAAPLKMLSPDNVRTALDGGPHIVSLSGHGSPDGCCDLDSETAGKLSNGLPGFVGYADSCLTNQFDDASMSEALLRNPKGGAVAYVGNSRFSWISVGDDFQRLFFSAWAMYRSSAHLGLLNDTRTLYADNYNFQYDSYGRWVVLSLNLLGCPEMPLWWRKPRHLRIPPLDRYERIRFEIEDPNPPDPPFGDVMLHPDWNITRVHLRQGEREQIFEVAGTSVDLDLSGFGRGELTMTVTRLGCAPLVRTIRKRSSRGLWIFLGLALALLIAAALLTLI